ncbi:MAG: DtxR family transcriptional regulator [Firmicutes bacterium]|nr:DtxR family transcriptional regulator [Bacillota bacterium]
MLDAESKLLTSSMEDYLEMIYRVCAKEGYVRMNKLADRLNVRPSSATKVVQRLSELEMVDYEKYGIIRLTEKGKVVGEYLLNRHHIIQEFLKNLGVEKMLLRDTELIEHCVSPSTLLNIYIFNRFISTNPDTKRQYEVFKANILT